MICARKKSHMNVTCQRATPIKQHKQLCTNNVGIISIFPQKFLYDFFYFKYFPKFQMKTFEKSWNSFEISCYSSSMYEYMKCVTSHMTQFSFIKIYCNTVYCLYVRDFFHSSPLFFGRILRMSQKMKISNRIEIRKYFCFNSRI